MILLNPRHPERSGDDAHGRGGVGDRLRGASTTRSSKNRHDEQDGRHPHSPNVTHPSEVASRGYYQM